MTRLTLFIPGNVLEFCELAGSALLRLGDLVGVSSSESDIWLPETNSLETDQNWWCAVGRTCGSKGSNGKLASARNQMRWRVAAAARRHTRQTPPANPRTTKLFSSASNQAAANRGS